MNICMIVPYTQPRIGGIATYVDNLSKKLINRGHEVTILTRGSWKNKCLKEDFNGISMYRILYVPSYPFHVDLHGIFLKKEFERLKSEFDLVHFHSPLIPSFSTHLPTISTIHGTVKGAIDNMDFNDLNSIISKVFSRKFEALEAHTIKNSNKVTTVSNDCDKEVNRLYKLKNKSSVVYNGVDTDFFVSKNKESSHPIVLYTGRLESRKGVEDLIMAAKYISKINSNIKFIIIGDGPLKMNLKKMVDNFGLSNCIHFPGFVSHEKIVEYYQNSTIYVLPSYYEGLPTVLLEAMSCEIAPIATNVQGNSELIKNGENGLLVSPKNPKELAEKIIYLIDNEQLRKKLGRNARKTVENNYSWEIIVNKFEKIYYETMNIIS